MWPEGTLVQGRPPTGARVTHRYVVAPDAAAPRFLLPRRRRAAAAVLRHFRGGGSARTRRRLFALRCSMYLSRGWPLARGSWSVVRTGATTIEDHLESVLDRPLRLGVQLGPPRANRKPIVQVLDHDDRPVAFGKVGTGGLTRRLVLAEGEALELLASWQLPGLVVPELLHRGEFNGDQVLLTSVLPLARADHLVTESARSRAMVQVASAQGIAEAPAAEGAWFERLRQDVATLDHAQIRHHLQATMSVLAADPSPWRLGCWHGDWTAWNMASLNGEVLLWDWERFESGVPLGWDALHFALRALFEVSEPVPEVARSLLRQSANLLAPFGVPPSAADQVAFGYLATLAARYTSEGQREAGGRTARVEEWLLPSLPTG